MNPPTLRLLVPGIAWPPETFLRSLLEGLSRSGVSVTAAAWNGRKPAERAPSGIDRIDLPPRRLGGPWTAARRLSRAGVSMLGSPRRFAQIARSWPGAEDWRLALARTEDLLCLARSWAPWDLIYIPWNSTAIDLEPLFGWGAPVVVGCRGSQVNVAPHNPARGELRDGLGRTFAKAAAVHCVSEHILHEATLWGLDASKGRIIRPAVDAGFFHFPQEERPRGKEFRIVSTGTLSWVKGHEFALRAARALADAGLPFRFDLVGEGPDLQRIQYAVSDLGLEAQVRLRGRLNPSELRELLWNGDAFLLMSLSEGISNAALEAMSCGLPVVSTACGGMPEAVGNGAEGFLVAVGDWGAAAEALMTLARAPERGREMGRLARERVLREFTIERQVREFLDLFQEIRRRASVQPPCAA